MVKDKIVKDQPSKIIKPGYRNLITVFMGLALVLILIILYFALSQALIEIKPEYFKQQVGFAIQVIDQDYLEEPETAAANSSQKIPGSLKEIEVQATGEFPASQKTVAEEKAGGELVVRNDYSQAQPLLPKTRFQTAQGLIFRSLEGVTVPAKGQLTIMVEADASDPAYEIGPAKFILPALSEWRKQYVYAESLKPMSKKTLTKFEITTEDINQATASLKTRLLNEAKAELSKDLPAGQNLLEQSLTAQTLEAKADPSTAVGSADLRSGRAEKFTLSLKLKIRVLAINENQLKQSVSANLPEIYKQRYTLTQIDPSSFTYEATYLEHNSENLLAQLKGEYNLTVASLNIDKAQLKGLSAKGAEAYLKGLGQIKEVHIRLPFWTNYLPALEDKINVQIKQ